MDGPARTPFGQHPSRSADETRRREIERVLAMTPRERALLALRLGQRQRNLAARSRAR